MTTQNRTVRSLVVPCIIYLFPVHEPYLVCSFWNHHIIKSILDLDSLEGHRMFPRGVHQRPPQTGMHLIFEIDEILRYIAERIADSSPTSAVSFACCCKAFDEPALNPLWRDICVVQLVQILPEDITGSFNPDLPSNIVRPHVWTLVLGGDLPQLCRYREGRPANSHKLSAGG